MPIDIEKVILCPDCDLLLEKIPVENGCRLVCPRCSCVLLSPRENSIEKTLAMVLAGLFLYLPANFLPLLTFDAAGLKSSGSIWDSWLTLANTGYHFVGGMVLLTSIVVPLIKLLLLFTVTFTIFVGRASPVIARCYRVYHHLDEWGMLEVYMIGILVTIIKMLHLAHVQYDTGFFCFIGLMMATLCSSAAMDEHLFWDEIERQMQDSAKGDKAPGHDEEASAGVVQ